MKMIQFELEWNGMVQLQTSFLEPPDFNHYSSDHPHNKKSRINSLIGGILMGHPTEITWMMLKLEYTGMMLLEEMASIFLTPFLLLFVVPKRVDDILQFIADFTVDVEGVGLVCGFSAFDFQNHGNGNHASPNNAPRAQRRSQGKMEKLFFRDQKLRGEGTRHTYSPGRLWQGSPLRDLRLRGSGDSNGLSSREMQKNLGSLWLIDADEKNHPYLLDWYYTSGPHSLTCYRRDTATRQFEPAEQQHGDNWVPTNITHNEARGEGYWPHHYVACSQSHLGASTSSLFFHESVLQHHATDEVAHHAKSNLWARSGSHGAQVQTSFLEPPDFNRYSSDSPHDNFSERSVEEEHDQFLDWRSVEILVLQCIWLIVKG
ncbi:hypothetical protein PTKIN_Ptkin15bG0116500 [Pterospermum kingtungense]